MVEYERVFRDAEAQGSRLFDLEQKIVFCKQNRDGIKVFLQKFEQGQLGHHNGNLMPLPLIFVECIEVGFKECIMIQQCPC